MSKKNLFYTKNIKNIKEIKQQINDSIHKRYTKLQMHTTSIINSILNRHKDPVKFNNIKLDQDIITDPSTIKSHIQQHFDDWTSPHNIDYNIFQSHWQDEYNPKQNINSN